MRNRLIGYLIPHAIGGFMIAALFVLGLLVNDVGGLRTLAAHSSEGLLAVSVLLFFCGLTFASVQMGIAIMMIGRRDDDDDDDRGPRDKRRGRLAPIRVPSGRGPSGRARARRGR